MPSGLITHIEIIYFCFRKLLECHFRSLYIGVTVMLDLYTYSRVSDRTELQRCEKGAWPFPFNYRKGLLYTIYIAVR